MDVEDDLDTTLTLEDFEDSKHKSAFVLCTKNDNITIQDGSVSTRTDPDDQKDFPSPRDNISVTAATFLSHEESQFDISHNQGSNSIDLETLCVEFGRKKINHSCNVEYNFDGGNNAINDPDVIEDLCFDSKNNQPEGEQISQVSSGDYVQPSSHEENERSKVFDREWWEFQCQMTEEGIMLRQKLYELELLNEYLTRLQSKRDRLLRRLLAYSEAGNLLKHDVAKLKETGAEESLHELSDDMKLLIGRKEHDLELMKQKYDLGMKQYLRSVSRAANARSPDGLPQGHGAHAIMKNAIGKLQNQIHLAEGQLFGTELRNNVMNNCKNDVKYTILQEVTVTIEHKILSFIENSIQKIDTRILLVRQDINATQSSVVTLQRHFQVQLQCRLYAAEY